MSKSQNIRFVFFGTSEFAIPTLSALVSNGWIPSAIVTAPDKPAGRKLNTQMSPIKKYCNQNKFIKISTLLQPSKIDSTFVQTISNLRPDIGIVVSYGKFLSNNLISLFKYGILNIHPSLLPKYRGPSPIQSAILNGDDKTGVTIMLIDNAMDHGSIVAKQELSIPNQVTYQELHDQLAKLGAEMIIRILPQWIADKIRLIPQNEANAIYTKLLKKEDGKIDWAKSAEEIERMIRAYHPWPGTYTTLKDGKILKIKKAEIIIFPNASFIPGTFFKASDGFPAITCRKNALKLLLVQPESRREISGQEFLRGFKQIISTMSCIKIPFGIFPNG